MSGFENWWNYDDTINDLANISWENQELPWINFEVGEVQGEAREWLGGLSEELYATALSETMYEYCWISENSTWFSDNCTRWFIDELIVSSGESIEMLIKNPSMIAEVISQIFSWETLKMVADEYKQSILTLINFWDSDAYEIWKSIAILLASISWVWAIAKLWLKAWKKAVNKVASWATDMKHNLSLARDLYIPDADLNAKTFNAFDNNYAFEWISDLAPESRDLVTSNKKSIWELVNWWDIYSKIPKNERVWALRDLVWDISWKPSEDIVKQLSGIMRNDADRIAMTEDLFNAKWLSNLSSEQLRWVVDVHNNAEGTMFNLTFWETRYRFEKLKELWLSREQINVVLDYGICGNLSKFADVTDLKSLRKAVAEHTNSLDLNALKELRAITNRIPIDSDDKRFITWNQEWLDNRIKVLESVTDPKIISKRFPDTNNIWKFLPESIDNKTLSSLDELIKKLKTWNNPDLTWISNSLKIIGIDNIKPSDFLRFSTNSKEIQSQLYDIAMKTKTEAVKRINAQNA